MRWLSVCRHRVARARYPYVMVLQHDIVAGESRIVAPVAPAAGGKATVLVPHITVGGTEFRVILLEMAAVPLAMLGQPVEAGGVAEQAIMDGLDAIFRGYPVGLPVN